MIQFDPEKDRANFGKHGISLARAADMERVNVVADERRPYGEPRYRAFGWIDDVPHCLVFTTRGDDLRAISLRRAHSKEMQRHAAQSR